MNKYIKIVRGDDTNFLNSCLLTISLNADISLAGFSAELRISSYVFQFDDVTTPSSINITAEQSKKLPLGNINGTYTLFDSENRRKIISTSIPFRVVTTVTSPVVINDYDVTINVNFEDIENIINVNFTTNGGGGTNDHNELLNRDLPEQHPMSSITGLEDALSSKQDTLVAGTGIAINGNVISNTQTSAIWGNIQGTLANQKDLSDQLQNIREVAEGKTNSYVVSYENNPEFNTQADSFQLTTSFTDINGVVHDLSELKLGDNIYVQELDVPDRWCSQPSEVVSGVPEGYTQLLYIQNTGTQYLDTGFLVDESNRNNIKLEVDGNFGVGSVWRADGSGGLFVKSMIGLNPQNVLAYGKFNNDTYTTYTEHDLTGRHKYVVDYQNGTYFRDGIEIASWEPSLTGPTNNLYIFTYATNGVKQSGSRKYNFKIYNNNVLVFNGVPARRDADNEIGMYDTVSNTFITNAGTGEFIYEELPLGVTLYKLETSKVTIPTKVSELQNDANYVDQTALNNALAPINTSITNLNTKISNTETWTFTLEDGTEVTKNIVVGA